VTAAGLRHGLARTAVLLFFIVLVGATYQGVATALERREFPRPGELVDVGGQQLHLHCRGEGSPLVVLEAGATGMSSAWGWVRQDVEPVTRVCSYDRAGLGWSDWGSEPFSAGAVVQQLDRLLGAAGERPPYLLVGHGLGAAFASLYASRFPANVHSLVLIDSPIGRPSDDTPVRFAAWWPWLARVGVLRATRQLSKSADGLPPDTAGAVRAFLNRPDHLTRSVIELAAWEETVALAQTATIPAEIPVTRLDVNAASRIALLSDSGSAAAASAAILTAVAAATH
jgi:pimeloyl-ACP methyl ester carboxylesterase